MNTMEAVRLEQVTVELDGQTVLEDVTLSLKENDFLGIIGPNGGGKTTLLKVILGIIRPQSGIALVFGSSPRSARMQMGYVPQVSGFDRAFPMTVFDAVLMGRIGKAPIPGYYSSLDRDKVSEAMDLAGITDLTKRQVGRLSEGQKQRVFIARALASEPKLLLLDEPTASVDPEATTEFYDILNKARDRMTIILVSHDIGVISSQIDKVACLNRRLFYHDSKEIREDDLKSVYRCPVDLIAHGVPHRVMKEHDGSKVEKSEET